MRIKLKENFNYTEVVNWMNQNIGPYNEGVTWFWSTDVYTQVNEYGIEVEKAESGIKIWKDCPERLVAAMMWQ